MATPMLASFRILLRSTRTTFPLFMRANDPFSLANSELRGKLISTMFPGLTGVAIGRDTRTPVLLIFAERPLKNLFASGSQTLTGHESSVLVCCRCSATVSIFNILCIKDRSIKYSCVIGNVKLGCLAKIGVVTKKGGMFCFDCVVEHLRIVLWD
jgi:hypothetical protein